MLETLYDLLIGDYRTLVGVLLSGLAAYALTLVGPRELAGLVLVLGAGSTLAMATHVKTR